MNSISRILLCVSFLSLAAPSFAESISIATYNIRYPNPGDGLDYWPHRADAVGSFLKKFDVIALQEAKFTQLKDLEEPLSEFQRYGVGRDDGREGGETVSIYFRRTRFELKEQGTIWLSDTPKQIGSKGWDAALPRILSWCLLVHKTDRKKLLVANTHFDHRGKRSRLESGRLVREFLSQKMTDELPIVLLGDFNCLPGSAPYQAITATGPNPLLDARSTTKSAPTGPNSTSCGFKKIVPGRIIDHVFVNQFVTVQQMETHDPKTQAGRFASDHLPVSVRIEF